ncbi:unnamed protein product [Pocillopora meandrina]|nr:unnamed protein product [Pocillopora meandrina]
MRDTLVFGTDSEEVRRKCIARGNELTFARAKEIARTDEATQMQLKAMNDYDRLNRSSQQIPLGPTHHRITAYGGHAIKTLGTCPLYVHQNGSIKEVVFNVTDVPGPTMLGCKTCEELELVKFNCSLETSKEDKETRLKEHRPCKPHQRTSRYPSHCFEGLGTFNMKPYHITLDSNAEPVIHAPRTVPVHLRDMFRKEINTMVELGVLIP